MRKMIRFIDADKACTAIENCRIRNNKYDRRLNDWEDGYNAGLERAEDEIQDFIVEAIPVSWLTAQAENPSNSDLLRNAIDYIVYTMWAERKEE